MCIGVLSEHMSTYVRVLDTVELELQLVVNCHTGSGIDPRSSGRAASACNPLSHLIAPALEHCTLNSVSNFSLLPQPWVKFHTSFVPLGALPWDNTLQCYHVYTFLSYQR